MLFRASFVHLRATLITRIFDAHMHAHSIPLSHTSSSSLSSKSCPSLSSSLMLFISRRVRFKPTDEEEEEEEEEDNEEEEDEEEDD